HRSLRRRGRGWRRRRRPWRLRRRGWTPRSLGCRRWRDRRRNRAAAGRCAGGAGAAGGGFGGGRGGVGRAGGRPGGGRGGRLGQALPGRDPNASVFTNRDTHVAGQGAHSLGGLVGTAARVPSTGAFAVLSDRNHFNIFINALQGRTNVKMLSTPHILAADNREAHILVGQSIPILTSSSSNLAAGTNTAIVNSVQYRDTGKILTILPQVNSKGLVNLQIR